MPVYAKDLGKHLQARAEGYPVNGVVKSRVRELRQHGSVRGAEP